jgi:hypothetical protein
MKVIIVTQFILIILNKQTFDSKAYVITEIVFKTSLAIFLEFISFYNDVKGIVLEDRIIISFAGGILLVDAWINDLPLLINIFKTS